MEHVCIILLHWLQQNLVHGSSLALIDVHMWRSHEAHKHVAKL